MAASRKSTQRSSIGFTAFLLFVQHFLVIASGEHRSRPVNLPTIVTMNIASHFSSFFSGLFDFELLNSDERKTITTLDMYGTISFQHLLMSSRLTQSQLEKALDKLIALNYIRPSKAGYGLTSQGRAMWIRLDSNSRPEKKAASPTAVSYGSRWGDIVVS